MFHLNFGAEIFFIQIFYFVDFNQFKSKAFRYQLKSRKYNLFNLDLQKLDMNQFRSTIIIYESIQI